RRSRSSATGAGGAARRWPGPVRSTAGGRRNRRGMSWLLSVDADPVRVAELVRAGDDDAFAFLQAGYDFHLAQAAGAGLDRAARGAAVLDHPGDAAAVLFQERATLDHQYVLARVEHDARLQALVLAQSRRLLAVGEAQAGVDLAVDHLGRHRRDLGLVRLAAAGDLRRDADAQVAGEAFRHLDLDLELGQVHHAEHRPVGDHAGALRHLHLADLAVERRADGQRVDLAPGLGDHRLLAVGEQALVARVQAGAFALQGVVL